MAARAEPLPDGRDRPLARLVDERERPPLGRLDERRVHLDPPILELDLRTPAQLVAAEGREERDGVREQRELQRGNGASSAGLLPRLARMRDLTRERHALHLGELDPLHVSDDSAPHTRHAHKSAAPRVER